jgi:hypothetical protein
MPAIRRSTRNTPAKAAKAAAAAAAAAAVDSDSAEESDDDTEVNLMDLGFKAGGSSSGDDSSSSDDDDSDSDSDDAPMEVSNTAAKSSVEADADEVQETYLAAARKKAVAKHELESKRAALKEKQQKSKARKLSNKNSKLAKKKTAVPATLAMDFLDDLEDEEEEVIAAEAREYQKRKTAYEQASARRKKVIFKQEVALNEHTTVQLTAKSQSVKDKKRNLRMMALGGRNSAVALKQSLLARHPRVSALSHLNNKHYRGPSSVFKVKATTAEKNRAQKRRRVH